MALCGDTSFSVSRRSPPLQAIEAFVAVVDAGGVRAGAERLALSASATSRRIATLEAFLGLQLFERLDHGLRLTPGGRRYLDAIEPAVAAIGRASDLVHHVADRVVLATSHSIATRWLMPKAAVLRSETGLTLDIIPTRDPDVLRSGEAQFALWGALAIEDLVGESIVEADMRPACAPILYDGRPRPRDLSELTAMPLLSPRTPANLWPRWLAAAGVTGVDVEVIEYATLGLVYEAAVAGMGVAPAIPMLCEAQLAAGSLVTCGPTYAIGERYTLYRVRRRSGRTDAETRLLHWLRREAAKSQAGFKALP